MITGVPVASPHSSGEDVVLPYSAKRVSSALAAGRHPVGRFAALRHVLRLQIAVRLEQAVDVLPNCTPEYQNKVKGPAGGKSSNVVHSLTSVLVAMWPR